MAMLVGIDEAGYGPVLGPLVVTSVAFRVSEARLADCLWDSLRESCTRDTRRGDPRLAVADSKALKRSGGGLDALERTALVMLAAAGHSPADLRELLRIVAPHSEELLAEYPWYAPLHLTLPVSRSVGDVGTRANAVRRDLHAQGVEWLGTFCECLPEGHFNRLVSRTRNKAVALLGLTFRVLDRALRLSPGERIRVFADRLGGRQHYREAIMTLLPGGELRIIEESETRSAYRVEQRDRTCEIQFATRGEQRHFTTALASVYSKYLRELFMHAFNRYWCGQMRGLRPTAGYYQDAQRWLGDAEGAIARLAVDRALLVRER